MTKRPFPLTYRAREVRQILRSVSVGDSCAIVGIGNAGKSTLLRFLQRPDLLQKHLEAEWDQYLLIYVDGNKLLSISLWGLIELMLHQTMTALDKHGHSNAYDITRTLNELYDKVIHTETRDFAVRYLDRALHQIRKRIDLRLVFLLDEFDALYARLPPSGFSALRALRDEHEDRLSYLVATRQEWQRLRKEPAATEEFEELVSPQTVWLRPYSEPDACDMLEHLAARYGKPVDGRTQRVLLEETGGHAGLLGAAYWTAIEQPQALGRSLRSSTRVLDECRRIWYSLPSDQQRVVGILAATQDSNLPAGSVLTMLRNKGLVKELAPLKYALFSGLFGDCIVRLRLHTGPQVRVERGLHLVILGGRRIEDMPPLLFNLIDYLEQHRDRACSRAELIHHLYPDEPQDYDTGYADSRLDTIVTRLRKAIEEDPSTPRYILTVRGVGYRLADGQTGD